MISAAELEACQRVWRKGRDPRDLELVAQVSARVERECAGANGFARWRSLSRHERKAWVEIRDERGKVTGYRDLPKRAAGERTWLCAPVVGPLIARLSEGVLAWCNATAKALRTMIFVDFGYVFGEKSVQRFITREVQRRRLFHKPIPPGAYFNKTECWTRNGTQLNRYPNEAERRETLWRAKQARRKQRRERSKKHEHERQERARRERAARRSREQAPSLVTLPPAVEVASPAFAHEQSASILADIFKPRAIAPLERPELVPQQPPALRDRAEERQRVLSWARDVGGDDPPPKG